MTSAGLFTLFALATVLLLAFRRPARRAVSPRFFCYYWALVLAACFLASITGYFAWRDQASIRELKTLVDLPAYERTIYVPDNTEIRTIARLLPGNVPRNYPLTRQESEAIRKNLMSSRDSGRLWILVTSSAPSAIRDFYQIENHRLGWEISEQSQVHIVLKRGDSTLTIFFLDNFPRPQTAVVYLLRGPDRQTI